MALQTKRMRPSICVCACDREMNVVAVVLEYMGCLHMCEVVGWKR